MLGAYKHTLRTTSCSYISNANLLQDVVIILSFIAVVMDCGVVVNLCVVFQRWYFLYVHAYKHSIIVKLSNEYRGVLPVYILYAINTANTKNDLQASYHHKMDF